MESLTFTIGGAGIPSRRGENVQYIGPSVPRIYETLSSGGACDHVPWIRFLSLFRRGGFRYVDEIGRGK